MNRARSTLASSPNIPRAPSPLKSYNSSPATTQPIRPRAKVNTSATPMRKTASGTSSLASQSSVQQPLPATGLLSAAPLHLPGVPSLPGLVPRRALPASRAPSRNPCRRRQLSGRRCLPIPTTTIEHITRVSPSEPVNCRRRGRARTWTISPHLHPRAASCASRRSSRTVPRRSQKASPSRRHQHPRSVVGACTPYRRTRRSRPWPPSQPRPPSRPPLGPMPHHYTPSLPQPQRPIRTGTGRGAGHRHPTTGIATSRSRGLMMNLRRQSTITAGSAQGLAHRRLRTSMRRLTLRLSLSHLTRHRRRPCHSRLGHLSRVPRFQCERTRMIVRAAHLRAMTGPSREVRAIAAMGMIPMIRNARSAERRSPIGKFVVIAHHAPPCSSTYVS